MKKMTAFLTAGLGVAILTGCQNNEVMKARYYKNTDGKEVQVMPAAKNIEAEQPQTIVQPQETPVAPEAPKAAVRTYEPMRQLESYKTVGIDENAPKSGTKAVSGKKVYKVKRGDTPGKIAYRHKVSLAALMQANNFTESDAKKLRVGQIIVIPAAGTKAVYNKKSVAGQKNKTVKSASAKKSVKVDASALNADGTYTVKRGDSPERIARKFKIKLTDLLNANNLDESSSRRLQLGQKLVIPGGASANVSSTPAKVPTVTEEKTVIIPPAEQPNAKVAAADASSNDLAAQLENAAPAGAPADLPAAENVNADNIVSHVILEKEISLADFAAQKKTTVEELRRINEKQLPDVLHQNDLINIPFTN